MADADPNTKVDKQDVDNPSTIKSMTGSELLEDTVDLITCGTDNQEAIKALYNKFVAPKIPTGDMSRIKWKTRERMNSFVTNFFNAFEPIQYEGKTIDPKITVNRLLNTAEELYQASLYRIFIGLSASVNQTTPFQDVKEHKAYAINLAKLVKSAGHDLNDLSVFLDLTCQRDDMVGKRTRSTLQNYGINVRSLKNDPKVLVENLLAHYQNFENKQLKQY